jgi:hypothetical protein
MAVFSSQTWAATCYRCSFWRLPWLAMLGQFNRHVITGIGRWILDAEGVIKKGILLTTYIRIDLKSENS